MKKFLKIICMIPILIGIFLGLIIAIFGKMPNNDEKKAFSNIVDKTQKKEAKIDELYIYGTSLNIKGYVSGISKDNLEGAKLILTNGFDEIEYKLDFSAKDNVINFESNKINDTIDLQNLTWEKSYLLLRLKLNNSTKYKYYSLNGDIFENSIVYYPINSDEKIVAKISEIDYKKQKYSFLIIEKVQEERPEDVFDIVIDAGHGGKDSGEKANGHFEADITLEYAEELEKYLSKKGLKVKLTRTKENSDTYTYTNMYNEKGRITVACESKAKYMISFHVNNDSKKTSGFEIYAPCKSNLKFAQNMSQKIQEKTDIAPSTIEKYKQGEGVYVRNFTKKEIEQFAETAKSKGYEPYSITLDTPYLYTIREVGGIATNAYVDGRNTAYSANKYYNSNYGIECYQIELRIYKNRFRKNFRAKRTICRSNWRSNSRTNKQIIIFLGGK